MSIPPKIKKNLEQNISIKHLDLSGCELDDEGINELKKNLEDTKCLSLNISRNDITEIGAAVLAQISTLEKLNIENNYIGDEGFMFLLDSSIIHLEAKSNGISKSAVHKAYAEKQCKHLRFLDIGYNLDREGNDIPISDLEHVLNKTDEVWEKSFLSETPVTNSQNLTRLEKVPAWLGEL